MPYVRFTYEFTVALPAARAEAYRWATDYRPDDFRLMEIGARRRVERLAPDLVLLTDSFVADPFAERPRRSTKVKLVHLYPERWRWVSTHVRGPARHSQFVYELLPLGRRSCRLRFHGAQVERSARALTAAERRRRERQLRHEDRQLWLHLAQALGRERSRP